MPEVLTRVDQDDSIEKCGRDYKTSHLLPRLRASTEDAGGYIAANLQDNADSPETIALAFRDVIQAYELPIEVVSGERARLERDVIEAARHWRRAQGESQHVAEVDAGRLLVVRSWIKLRNAIDGLIDFESSQQQIKK